jgi:hypothetical protein
MLARLFGPAARKIRFHVKLTISRLTNLPLRDCQCFVKWKGDRVGGSTGTTSQRPVIQHCVVWNETIDMDVTLLVSRETDYLLPAQLRLSVRKVRLRVALLLRAGVTVCRVSCVRDRRRRIGEDDTSASAWLRSIWRTLPDGAQQRRTTCSRTRHRTRRSVWRCT